MSVQGRCGLRRPSGVQYYTPTDKKDILRIKKWRGTYGVHGSLSVDNPDHWATLFSETTMRTGYHWEELAEDDALVAELVVRSVRRRVSHYSLAKAKA